MNVNYTNLEKYIDKENIRYDEPMSKHTTLKVGGNCDVMVLPKTNEDILNVINFAKENNVPVTVIGNGSKLLVLDGGIRGIVIKLSSKFASYTIEDNYIEVAAGMSLPRLSIIAKDNGLSGLEFAAGIPGNVGGAVYMNAGAYGSEMSNIIEEVTFIDEACNIKTISNEECNFSYRNSIFRSKDYVILSTKLKLVHGNKEEIAALMNKNNDSRREKQPLEYPNAGSTFKRPEGYFAGKLIQDAGLAGFTVGGAQVSAKHCGFVINAGGATAADIVELMKQVSDKVEELNGIPLEAEVKMVGEF